MEGLAALSQSFGQTIAQGLPQQVQQRRELDQRKAEADVTAKNAERGLGIQERYAATAEAQAKLGTDQAALVTAADTQAQWLAKLLADIQAAYGPPPSPTPARAPK